MWLLDVAPGVGVVRVRTKGACVFADSALGQQLLASNTGYFRLTREKGRKRRICSNQKQRSCNHTDLS